MGNAFLGHIRDTDAIVFVLRAFDNDPDETASGGAAGFDPLEQLCLLETELALADLESGSRQLKKLARIAKGDSTKKASVVLLENAVEVLGEGTPLYRADFDVSAKADLQSFFLLTNKPMMVILNISEDDIGENASKSLEASLSDHLGNTEVITICAQLEAEASQLEQLDRAEILAAMGIGDGALPRFLANAYQLLGLRTFLTTGEKESRAWTFSADATAAECAGVIHSDFQRGFIRADTIRWDELLQAGSWSAAREQGLVRSEGKTYQVADGDVLEFKFNV